MPATTSNPNKQKDDKYEPSKFISSKLTNDQKEAMVAWADDLSHDDLLALLASSIMQHYQLSCRQRDTAFQASLSPIENGSKHRHKGLVLVARASTPLKALYGLFYRHFELYGEDWASLPTGEEAEW